MDVCLRMLEGWWVSGVLGVGVQRTWVEGRKIWVSRWLRWCWAVCCLVLL